MRRRHRPNPTLAIFGNPPMRRTSISPGTELTIRLTGGISDAAESIAYKHVHNGKMYKHDFETGVSLLTGKLGGKNVVVIVGDDDIWDDYPDES